MIHEFDHGDDVKVLMIPPVDNIRGTFHAIVRKNMKTYYIVEQSGTGMHYWAEPEHVIPDKLDSKNPNKTFKKEINL